MADADFLRELVRNPREALAIEIKAWIDPKAADGAAKIAKCLLALRNHGGGFMVIGFDDVSSLPVTANRPSDVRATFHADTIQLIVTRYASEPFEVTIHFPERDGFEFPVIEVPGGVRTPVAAKADLIEVGVSLIRKDSVFVRSLNSSGVVGSTIAGWNDWARLLETCFDNREADIGRFLRRHLSNVSADMLRSAISALSPPSEISFPTYLDRLKEILDTGLQRFRAVRDERSVELPAYGWWEIAAIVRGAQPPTVDALTIRDALLASNPNLTGWPAWVDSRHFGLERFRPYFVDDDETWEAFVDSLEGSQSDHLDFWRISPRGEFYLYRAYQDDAPSPHGRRQPLTEFDFGLPILRTAEVVAVGLAFARVMGATADSSSVAFEFRWNSLKGRVLSAWAFPDRVLHPGRRAYRDVVESIIDVPVETPPSALHTFVQKVTAPLYAAFDNFAVPNNVSEELVTKLLNHQW